MFATLEDGRSMQVALTEEQTSAVLDFIKTIQDSNGVVVIASPVPISLNGYEYPKTEKA